MMATADIPDSAQDESPSPTWTYPTRFCRICREDVPATVTMYPPGLPPAFQRPIVEYRNEDEYGRLIKPCHCRGGMRYIHELCLLRSRTEVNRAGSRWKCHECGHKFNFQKLAIQRFLNSNYASGVLTVVVMVAIMFILGFIADPIINLYVDPYDTITGREPIWNEVKVKAPISKKSSWWAQHFVKGLVSMGLVGFTKTYLLNPLQWWRLRTGDFMGTRTTSSTGRDRAVNISWVAVLIGVSSAFYFFYQWVQTIIQKVLQRIGNNIVDTQLPGDDDDLKPPPGWKSENTTSAETPETSEDQAQSSSPVPSVADDNLVNTESTQNDQASTKEEEHRDLPPRMTGSWMLVDGESNDVARSSALDSIQTQGWSFSGI